MIFYTLVLLNADCLKSSRIMATSSLRSKFEEHFTCSVCLEQLKDPKVLPCLHSFCHDCIVKLPRNRQTKNMACPECRKVVQVRSDECSWYILKLINNS